MSDHKLGGGGDDNASEGELLKKDNLSFMLFNIS